MAEARGCPGPDSATHREGLLESDLAEVSAASQASDSGASSACVENKAALIEYLRGKRDALDARGIEMNFMVQRGIIDTMLDTMQVRRPAFHLRLLAAVRSPC